MTNLPVKSWLNVYTDIYFDQSTPIPSIFMQGTRSDVIACTVRLALLPDDYSDPKRLQAKLRFLSEIFNLYLTCDCDGLINGVVCETHRELFKD